MNRDHGLSGEEQRLADLLKRSVPEPPRQLTYEEITVQRAGLLRKSWLVPAMAAAAILVIGGSIGAVAATRSGPTTPARPPVSGQSSPAPVPSPTGPTTPTCPPGAKPIPKTPTAAAAATAVPVPPATAVPVPAATAAPATAAVAPKTAPTAKPTSVPSTTAAPEPVTTASPVPAPTSLECATPAPVASPSTTPVPPRVPTATAVPVPSPTTPRTVVVPSVIGQTRAQAAKILESAGVVVTIVQKYSSQHVPVGTVWVQTPAAGSVVPKGSMVILDVEP